MPSTQTFAAYSGDTFTRKFKFLEDDLTTPINISTWEFAMEIKLDGKSKLKFTTTPAAGLTKGGVDNNELTFTDKLLLKGGTYSADLEATKPDGSVKTYMAFIFEMTQDVTNTTLEK